MTAEFKDDVAHCIRCLAEHCRNTRKTLWCGQRICGQIHVCGRTGDHDGCERNRIRECCCWAINGEAWPCGTWAGKIKTMLRWSRSRSDPAGKVCIPVRRNRRIYRARIRIERLEEVGARRA